MNYEERKKELFKALSNKNSYISPFVVLFMGIEISIKELITAIKNKYFIKDRRN